MEITFNQIIGVGPEVRAFAERTVQKASFIARIPSPTIHFFQIVEASRDPSLIVTEERAFGFTLNGEIFIRTDLAPGQMVRTLFHEVAHAAESRRLCRTLEAPHSDEVNERDAWLFAEQHAGYLSRNASVREAFEFLDRL